MDPSAYARMAESEDHHWWFAGRRAVLAALLRRELGAGEAGPARPGPSRPGPPRPGPLRILEAGCGSGGNLAMLSRFGTVEALEYDPGARALAARRSGLPVRACALPHDLPVPDRAYDLVALLDVLEHVAEDRATLAALGAKLAPGGRLLVTVPALPWLWSEHDARHHHHRRYTRASLVHTARAAGLRVERVGYFNTLLFPLALVRRLAAILTGRAGEDDRVPAAPLNRVLGAVFSAERYLAGRVRMPIGLSLFALVSRAD